ncbi:MAG: hypothetical protein QW175_05980 [Candidatus Bathyarchaeia archaeon]
MAFSSDADLAGFLSVFKSSARNVYSRGLRLFQQFYVSQGSFRDFLDRVERDRLLPRRERRRIAAQVLNDFVVWLSGRGYAQKTIRVYVGAVQSLAKYYDVPISLRYVRLRQPSPSIGSILGL